MNFTALSNGIVTAILFNGGYTCFYKQGAVASIDLFITKNKLSIKLEDFLVINCNDDSLIEECNHLTDHDRFMINYDRLGGNANLASEILNISKQSIYNIVNNKTKDIKESYTEKLRDYKNGANV